MTTNDDDIEQLRADLDRVHTGLVTAIRDAWTYCEQYYDPVHGIGRGGNLPELLRAALEEVAGDVGGTEGLVQHRPGSWEAADIRHLAAMADWSNGGEPSGDGHGEPTYEAESGEVWGNGG